MGERFQSFREFWPYYVAEHSNGWNRLLHCAGTASLIPLILAAYFFSWYLLLLYPAIAYGFARIGHLVVEHNQPTTFQHPLWSLVADFKMSGLMVLGRLDDELRQAKRKSPGP